MPCIVRISAACYTGCTENMARPRTGPQKPLSSSTKGQNSKHIWKTEVGSNLTRQYGAQWRRKQGRKRSGPETNGPPPSCFYLLTAPKGARREADEDALMCVSCHYSGLRYIRGDNRKPGWSTKFETLTEVSHFDTILSERKNTKDEIHRSFEIHFVASNLPTHDWIRLILTELQDRGISMSRATHVHPPNPRRGEDLGPTKIVVVLQSFGVQEAALLFHCNERFAKYSWKEQGLRCREPRPTHQRSVGRMVHPPDWNMEDLWSGPGHADAPILQLC